MNKNIFLFLVLFTFYLSFFGNIVETKSWKLHWKPYHVDLF